MRVVIEQVLPGELSACGVAEFPGEVFRRLGGS
jgi:hypothetical protein